MADEAEIKNAKRAVMELTRDRKEALAEAENLRKDLKAREDDVKAAVEAKDKACLARSKGPRRLRCLISGRLRPLRTSIPTTSCLALRPSGNRPSNASLVWTSLLFSRTTTRIR